jgi:hyaluronan synthase
LLGLGPVARTRIDRALRGLAVVYIVAIGVGVVAYKAAFAEVVTSDPFFAAYGLVVAAYLLSRFVVSLWYVPGPERGLVPHVAVVVPAFNEEEAIGDGIASLLAQSYPPEKLELVVVDDGSTDGPAREIELARDRVPGGRERVQAISFPHNRGKRAAMAAGIRATSAEIIAFVDSDSVLEPDALRTLVQRFADRRVGAVCGHADVLNAKESLLTRMQTVRYYVAFRVIKAAESVFNAVTCCSGCFAAYRREAIAPHLERWEHQRFLGAPATFGDDRSLTNAVLRGWRVVYEANAVSRTIVPATMKRFLVQQVRWKRSWTRESLVVARFIWRKNPLAAAATYLSVVLPLLAPFAAVRALVWLPAGGRSPWVYLLGVYAVALMYGLYYAARRKADDALWMWGCAFVLFYLTVLVWQTYYAVFTATRTTWGTRPSTHGASAPVSETAA